MTADPKRRLDLVDLSDNRIYDRIETLATRFGGASLSIEEFLTGDIESSAFVGFEAELLLFRLIQEELARRHAQGEHPEYDEYARRFPRDDDLVERAFLTEPDPTPSIPRISAVLPEDSPLIEGRHRSIGGDRYELLRKLGVGSFGTVWLARDWLFNREVAIKVPHPELITAPENRLDVMEEARRLASFEHENIVRIFDVEPTAIRTLAIVMEFCEGGSLEDELEHRSLEPTTGFREGLRTPAEMRRCIDVLLHVAKGLAYINPRGKGWRHCDLKPSNIVFKNGVPKIVDFGLALHFSEQLKQNWPGGGSPRYCAPEQSSGTSQGYDLRTDLFALGVIAYEWLAGTHPFAGTDNQIDLIFERKRDPRIPAHPIRSINPHVSVELERIVLDCLVKDQEKRLGSIEELVERLEKVVIEDGISAPIGARLTPMPPAEPEFAPINTIPRTHITERFVAREADMERMEEALSQSGMVALTGIPGVGKTLTAAMFANDPQRPYRYRIWVPAENSDVLTAALTRLAEPLHLDDIADRTLLAERVLAKLATLPDWILVYDNVDDFSLVKRFLPPPPHAGHLLLTSVVPRHFDVYDRLCPVVTLREFLPADGARFLLARTGREQTATDGDRVAAEEISKEVQGLPLALEQAGAYITDPQRPCSLPDYLDFFRENAARLMKRGVDTVTGHGPVTVTFELSLQRLRERCPEAVAVMHLCSFFAPDDIPEELLEDAPESVRDAIPALRTRFGLHDTLREGADLAIITSVPGSKRFSMHRLVQIVLRAMQSAEESNRFLSTALATIVHAFPEPSFENREHCKQLSPHARSLLDHAQRLGCESQELLMTFSLLGRHCAIETNYPESESLLRDALALGERQLGANHPVLDTVSLRLGYVLLQRGKLHDAESMLRHTLDVVQCRSEVDQHRLAVILVYLGRVLTVLFNLDEAELHLQRALALLECGEDPNDDNLVGALCYLGKLAVEKERFSEAQSFSLRALRVYKRRLDEKSPTFAAILSNMGVVLAMQGRQRLAVILFHRVLLILMRIFPDDHPEVATAHCNLGLSYEDLRKKEDAEIHQRRALAIREQILDVDHPELAYSRSRLGAFLVRQGNDQEGAPLLQLALAVQESVLNARDSRLVYTRKELGTSLLKRGEASAAEPLFLQAMESTDRVFGSDDPCSTAIHEMLCLSLLQQRKLKEAKPLLQQWMKRASRRIEERIDYDVVIAGGFAENLRALAHDWEFEDRWSEVCDICQLRVEILHLFPQITTDNLADAQEMLRDALAHLQRRRKKK